MSAPVGAVRHVAVVGGGISGLSAAYYLKQAGIECTLVEASPRMGGVIRTEQVDGCLVEAGPDSFIAQKPWALELIREIGLGDEVIGSNDSRRKTFVVKGGRLIPLPDGVQFMAPTRIWPMIKTPLLSWGAKAKMAAEWLRRPVPDPPDRTVAEFVIDHYGSEVNEYLAQPMLAGVYGGSPEQLSVKAVLPRFLELEQRYGSLSRGMAASMAKARRASHGGGSLFLTLRGGMQQLVDALVDRIRDDVRVLHEEVAGLTPTAEGWELQLDGRTLHAGAVILAIPGYRAARLLRTANPGVVEPLQSIPYNSSVTAALIYHRPEFTHPLEGFGFLAPRAENRLVTACTWVNTKFDHRAPDSRAFLRAFLAGKNAEDWAGRSDDDITRAIDQDLRELMGFDANPYTARIARWDRVMAQYAVGHGEVVNAIRDRMASTPGVHLSGNAYEGIGVPDCIRLSRDIVRSIAGAA